MTILIIQLRKSPIIESSHNLCSLDPIAMRKYCLVQNVIFSWNVFDALGQVFD